MWRSLYLGETPLTCYLEVLARFRFDPSLQSELAQIEEDDVDGRDHATVSGGVLPRSWIQPRLVGRALLTGWYAVPGDKESLSTLRARFLPLATRMHLSDVDAAAIRLAEQRAFTQQLAAWLFHQSGPGRRHRVAVVRTGCRHRDAAGRTPVCGAVAPEPRALDRAKLPQLARRVAGQSNSTSHCPYRFRMIGLVI
ncbi:MAG: hypothetical protein QOK10_1853 [Pseudonocardiales bacterium]|nr:hypothetical protein [Pseudonocardiales bacterium]